MNRKPGRPVLPPRSDEEVKQLRSCETRYQEMAQQATEALENRNRLIREALNEGWTHAQVAEATGLSRGRVSQIR